jgi:DMSO/TMAO reductase YedYZ molybdopterin-dependent catalytic subunit
MHRFLMALLGIAALGLGSVWPASVHARQESTQALLRVTGLDGAEVSIDPQAWAKLPRATVKATEHGGTEATFEGVPARELLKLVNAPAGRELRGAQLTLYVVAEAADGYRVVYALAELDAAFTDGVILVADRRNGEALGEEDGPLRIVVPWERRQARWARQLIALRVGRASQ